MKQRVPLSVLLDEGAPIATGAPFETRGYRTIRHGDVLAPGTKDEVVAATAQINNAALIAVDKDMKQLAKRFGNPVNAQKFKRLNLIFVACNPGLAPKRIENFMSLIEHEWEIACQKASRSMWIEIGPHHIRSMR